MSFPEWFTYWFGGDETGVIPLPPPEALSFDDPFVPGLHFTDHVALGLSRLIEQFKRKPKIEALLASWLKPIQGAENIFWALKLLRGLYTSFGKQLDNIGLIVGEPERRGEDDDRYRVRILARIAVNLSNGHREDILAVASLLLPEGAAVYARDLYPAAVLYQVVEPWAPGVEPFDLWAILRAAEAAGVNLDLTYTTSAAVDTLTGDSVYGSATVSTQWPGSTYAPTYGGDGAATFG